MLSQKILSNNYLRVVLIAIAIGFFGCSNQSTNTPTTIKKATVNNNLPKVVATTSVLCDLTKQIAANNINLTCLISPGTDPHLYEPNPEDRKAIEQANLIFYNGYNLEPGLIKIIKATKSRGTKIAVGQLAVAKPQQFKEGNKAVINPHIWHNAKNAIAMVNVISQNLGKMDSSNAQDYTKNAKKINFQLTQLDNWIKSRIASIPVNQRQLVTTHNAMGYYSQAYGLKLAGTLEGVSTQARPANARITNLVKRIQQARVPTIFTEATANSNLIQAAGKEAKVKVSNRKLYTDGLGEIGSDGESYQKMMAANTRTIVEGLGGTYLIFQPKATK
jgi:manganese/iron transport system substrate-binding protein